jgi:hypothetical protein
MDILLAFSFIVVLEFIALCSVKYYSLHKVNWTLFVSMMCYATIPVFIYFILAHGANIATTNITWNIMSTLYGLLIGLIIYHEKLGSLQVYGAILGLVSLFLLFYRKKEVN